MILYPAIDIKDGNVVRLVQGKFDEVTKYSTDPVDMARHWKSKGAQWLHVVDLDGALTGKSKNIEVIKSIAKSVDIPVQVGGGIRNKEVVAELIESGIQRVILGTKAIEDSSFLVDLLSLWKDKIAVSLDCSNGLLTQRGWTSTSDIKATDFAKELEILGLKCIIHTDIAKDGMLLGPNYDELKSMLRATSIPIIASGGVASIEDIIKLKELEADGVCGAITGKAIYEGKLDLVEALKLC